MVVVGDFGSETRFRVGDEVESLGTLAKNIRARILQFIQTAKSRLNNPMDIFTQQQFNAQR
jgi:hypothetical protein